MLSHEEMVSLQAEHHGLVTVDSFCSEEEYVLYLMHQAAYEAAAAIAHDRRVLDFGCNNGYGCAILNGTSESVTGVDVSTQAITAAREKYRESDIRFEVVDGNASSLAGEVFEVITSFQVIEHIVDVASYLSNLQTLLNRDGLGVLTTPNASLRLFEGMRPWNRFHVHEYTAQEFRVLLEKKFRHVAIYGLFADEPLYSIEKDRVERARKRARARQEKEQKLVYRTVRSSKQSLKRILRIDRLLADRKVRRKRIKAVDPVFVEENSTANFYYDSYDLDRALDLLAICSNSENALQRAAAHLGRRGNSSRENSGAAET